MKKRITSLVFDFGNVITLPQDRKAVAAMAAALGGAEPAALAAAYAAGRDAYDRGDTGPAEYWRGVGERLGVRVDDALLAELKRLDVASWFNMNEAMLDFIRARRGEVRRLALLSNINEEGVRQLTTNAPWLASFDVAILSCEHRLLKPEPAIFELCLERLGEAAGDCLFIDDLAVNVAGARAVGMVGHVFTGLPGLEAELAGGYALAR